MNRVRLGNTDVQVSELCLGTMPFGSRVARDTAFALLDQFAAAGGTFVDTANLYAHWMPGCAGGESERVLGEWLRARGSRSRMVVATKVGQALPGTAVGLRAAQIELECERSLRRLGVETIDLYYAHLDDGGTPQEETMAAFARLVAAGKVRAIGASNFTAPRLQRANEISRRQGWPAYCCVQQRHGYLRLLPGRLPAPTQPLTADLLALARREPLTILAYGVLLRGALARPDRPLPPPVAGPDGRARLRQLRRVAAELGATPGQVALAWLRQSTPPILPVVGASTPAQLAENLAALAVTLTPAQMARLDAAGWWWARVKRWRTVMGER